MNSSQQANADKAISAEVSFILAYLLFATHLIVSRIALTMPFSRYDLLVDRLLRNIVYIDGYWIVDFVTFALLLVSYPLLKQGFERACVISIVIIRIILIIITDYRYVALNAAQFMEVRQNYFLIYLIIYGIMIGFFVKALFNTLLKR